jgi:hypothetical protein
LVINKCLEKNAGIFYKIQDFRAFKTRLGLDPEEGASDEEDLDEQDIYAKSNIVFLFHAKAVSTQKPGKATGERLEKGRQIDFKDLSKIVDWRKKLDDQWTGAPFITEDRLRWTSVQHYLEASKFKKGFHDFYEQFSLNNPSELSRDVELAMKVGDTTLLKYKTMRPEKVKVDPDYFLGRREKEREEALRGKFTQNEDLKQLLLATRDATLKKMIRRKPAEPDVLLMQLRKSLLD